MDRLAGLAREVARLPWFDAAGEPLTEAERDEAALYLVGIGRADVAVHAVPGWREAKAIASDPGWDRAWWDAEEAMRETLAADAAAALGAEGVHRALTQVTEAAREVVEGAAAVAIGRAGLADPGLAKAAAGAAAQAAYQVGLARLAGAGSGHAFSAKFRLFAAGRWPLGVYAERYCVL